MTKEELIKAKRQYKIHQKNTRNRFDKTGLKIEFKLSFDEWLDIWIKSGFWHLRGRNRGCYVMSRLNDIGHYEINNVFIQSVTDNHSQTYHPPYTSPRFNNPMLGKKGIDHPKSKKIQTPLGIFNSIVESAIAHNVKSMTIQYRCKKFPDLYKKV